MTPAQVESLVIFLVIAFVLIVFGAKVIYDDHKREKEKRRRLGEFSKNLSAPLD